MDKNPSKVTIHMVSSLDGFIAKTDGDISWMKSTGHYEKGVSLTDDYIAKFLSSIDCYVMGSKTYEHALSLGWPYGETPVIVVSNRNLPIKRETVEIYAGDLTHLVNEKLKPKFKNIWMVGGATLTRTFIQSKLADELVITLMPILLGQGLPFFDQINKEQRLHLKNTMAFKDGMVELTYEFVKQ